MALSNAQRQARYRARLKARAAPEALGERVREAAETAIAALWAFFNRPAPDGEAWGDIEGCPTPAAYRARLAADPGALLAACRDVFGFGTGLLADEAAALELVIAIADALVLASREGNSPGGL